MLFKNKIFFASLLGLTFYGHTCYAEEDFLILEPIVQNYKIADFDYVYAIPDKGRYFLSLQQVSFCTGFKYTKKNGEYEISFLDKPDEVYRINLDKLKAENLSEDFTFQKTDYKIEDGEVFFADTFFEKLLGIDIDISALNMILSIDRPEIFPNLRKMKAQLSRERNGISTIQQDPITNYDFDDRWFSVPVVDFSYGQSYSKGGNKTKTNGSYSVSMGSLFAGLDLNTYIAGTTQDSENKTIRLTGSRTFLTDNVFNLRTLDIGDISNVNSSLITKSSSGRGVAVSSFKNLVVSANKTIDIVGPLVDGWEVELWWNDQLIGYRQQGTDGQYNFTGIPVSFGLNTFKLIFYGPYGEIRTEEKRYYSGTSPVKKGELGYTASALQSNRSLYENKFEKNSDDTDIFNLDLNLYYGLTDNIALMSGITQTADSQDNTQKQYFYDVGIQTILSGTSFQYNLESNIKDNEYGHHFEWQGDVYIGSIYASYDYFNKLHSPNSWNGSEYDKKRMEVRFSGILPYSMPYYISYKKSTTEFDENTQTISGRIFKTLFGIVNLTLEDNFYKREFSSNMNTVQLGAFMHKNNISWENWISYQTLPSKELQEFSSRLEWRDGRYTYYSGKFSHNFISESNQIDLSAGRLFDFGGLTLSFSTDTDFKNYNAMLTYTIGFGGKDSLPDVFPSPTAKLSKTGTLFAKLYDENGQSLEGVGLYANSADKPVFSNEDGEAILPDLQTYEKVAVNVDLETIEDLALRPNTNDIKLVLRPGAIRYLSIPFAHYGSIEGQAPNPTHKKMFGYRVYVQDENGREVVSTYTDLDGYYILENIPFGTYDLFITKEDTVIKKVSNIFVNDFSVFVNK